VQLLPRWPCLNFTVTAQRTLLRDRLVSADCDAAPRLHVVTQGTQCCIALGEFRGGRCAFGAWRTIERGGEHGIRADVDVLLLEAVD